MSLLNGLSALFKTHRGTTKPELTADIEARLKRWQALPKVSLDRPFENTDFVVLDLETSGFSFKKDHVIAIGACKLQQGRIPLAQSFQIILKQEQSSSKDNILVHHISDSEQRSGIEPAEALMQFLEYLGKDPLIVYHVGFDQPMLDKALKQYLGIELKQHTWFDVAFVAPIFLPKVSTKRQSLDFWSTHFNINNPHRHSAVFDAIATAEVMQAVMKQALKENSAKHIGATLSMQTLYKMQRRAMKIHRQLYGTA
ncbi:DNA polymerase III PolC-type [Oligella urethralis]|uniref:DNA-directed DNA polymerase n=1 Tax=Oligella urethralis TaxID=90245 RepID=A0A2X1VGW5_9BURK|nr:MULTISPECIES: 3'-5' exonuclease [Oligella]OFS84293.1 DNA polymerase III subunit epsilon [Oligella sp. HMSC05A10]OFV46048.1 DNA polymerase III subunit epsilon [Oligella sp. HMSC09E12]WOS36613.1 DNA polymerase III PolC-type [Oligella urethralis]SPY07640.1 DNA polymerase III polC-type [Oligella urethralis]SUA52823.1 DNA polymerase III polC-type [Oligella urethralis]